MPAIAEGNDGFLYVLKFRGAGQGIKALIAELIGGELAAQRPGEPAPDIRFEDVGAGQVRSDERKLRRLLSNLVDNADKYIGDGGSVVVRPPEQGSKLRISVEDDQVRFFRLDLSQHLSAVSPREI